ncbi:hypothetical protein FPOAC1_002031 [Fusarium poae]|uniref:hypothetical protein n=1 Tax=Fusarium poae TaxID=36050 RepID=UPI001CE7E1C1|nr:hypothetical protein FPOAC1_002031 [Fusarium poae]KAG8676035.1 hypothetical protein FPOAC1_002031 [Fusarium poae]
MANSEVQIPTNSCCTACCKANDLGTHDYCEVWNRQKNKTDEMLKRSIRRFQALIDRCDQFSADRHSMCSLCSFERVWWEESGSEVTLEAG